MGAKARKATCPVCTTEFSLYRNAAKTCSYECGYEYRKRRYKLLKTEKTDDPDFTPPAPEEPAPPPEPPAEPTAPFPEADRRWTPPDPPAVTGRTGRDETVLFIPDIHVGDHDERAVALMLGIIRHVQPDRIIQLGDCLDFYALSRFDNNPLRFAARVQYELDIQAELYAHIRDLAPNAFRQQILGNHEERGVRFLWSNPALADLRMLQLPALMKLGELGWEPEMHHSIMLADGAFIVTHGTHVRKWAGWSAKAQLDTLLTSGISGHTHRMSLYSHSSHAGELVWCEAGCLQKNPPEWNPTFANWQHGVVLGTFERDGNAFNLEPIRFRRSYKCRIGNVELSA